MTKQIIIGCFLLLLAACGGTAAELSPEPVELSTLPDGTEVLLGEAFVDEVDVAILESFPVQVIALVKGTLPDGCTELVSIEQERVENEIVVSLITQRPAEAACTEALVPFEETVSVNVDNLAAGDYLVNVNDTVVGFRLDVDNILVESEPEPATFVTELSEADRAEIIRQTLERAVVMEELPDLALLLQQGNEIVLSTENIDPALVTNMGEATFVPLSPERIRDRANEQGDFLFLHFLEIAPSESGTVLVSLANEWAVAENSESVYLSGGGFTLEFSKTADSWQNELLAAWIS